MFSAFSGALQSASRVSRTASSSANAASLAVRNARASRFLEENNNGQGGAGLPNPQPVAGAPMRGAVSRLVAGFTGPSNSPFVPPRNQPAGLAGSSGYATVEPGSISSRVLAAGISSANGLFIPPPNQDGSQTTPDQSASPQLAAGFNTPPNGLFVPPPMAQGQSNAAAESGGAIGGSPVKGILKRKELWDRQLNLRWQPANKEPRKHVAFSDDVKGHHSASGDNEPPTGTTQKTVRSNPERLSPAMVRATAMAINSQPPSTKVNTLLNKMGMMTREGTKLRQFWAQGGKGGTLPATIAEGANNFSPISASAALRMQLRPALASPVGSLTAQQLLPHSGSSDTAAGTGAPAPSPLVAARTVFFSRKGDGGLTQISPPIKKRTLFLSREGDSALTQISPPIKKRTVFFSREGDGGLTQITPPEASATSETSETSAGTGQNTKS